MTKQVLKTVYELDEVKEKAIEKNRYINVNYNDWYESTVDDWQEKIDNIGFTSPQIYFSGFYSQGDGACFDSDIDVEKITKYLQENDKLTGDEVKKILYFQDGFLATIEKNNYSYHYNHEKTRYINIDNINIDDKNDKILLDKLEYLLENLRYDLCCKIYDDLENEYNYLTSDSTIYETLQLNDYYFESNGEIAIY